MSDLTEPVRFRPSFPAVSLSGALLIGLAWLPPAAVHAQGVYKYVDGQGVVTYSQTPPAQTSGVTSVRVAPAPAQGEQSSPQSQERSAVQQAAELDERRARQRRAREERTRELAQARDELRRSEEALEAAQTSHRADTYRIELMERQVELARQNLRQVEQGQR